MPSSGAKEQTGMRETQFRNSPSEGKLGLILSQPDHRKHKNTFTMTGSSGFRGFTSERPLSVRDCLKFLRPPPVLPVSRSQNWVQEGQTPLPRASLSLATQTRSLSHFASLPPSLLKITHTVFTTSNFPILPVLISSSRRPLSFYLGSVIFGSMMFIITHYHHHPLNLNHHHHHLCHSI